MSLLNSLDCIDEAGNTGIGTCFLDFKKIIGAILTPKGFILTSTNLATSASLITALQAASLATLKANRIFPIGNIVNAEDNSSGLTKQTFGYGAEAPVRDGINNWVFQYVEGGLSLHKKMRQFNKTSAFDFLFIDDENKILGTLSPDGTGLMAIPSMYFWAHQWKANTGAAVSEYKLEFAFLPQYVNEMVAFAKADSDITSQVKGLVDVNVTSPSANVTSGSYNVVAKTADTGFNLSEIYSAELADVAVWKATKTSDGSVIAILSATYSAGIGGFVLALDKTDPNYPASGTVTIAGEIPSTLATNGVVGYEFGSVAITKN